KFWGLQEQGNTVPEPTDPENPNKVVSGTWLQILSHVSVFLQRSALSYAELRDLLDTLFVNREGKLRIDSFDPNDSLTCNVAKLRIAGLSQDSLDRIHRFLRLRQALNWDISELDKVLTAFQATLDDSLLLKVSQIQRLGRDTQVPVVEMLSWWAPIDTD